MSMHMCAHADTQAHRQKLFILNIYRFFFLPLFLSNTARQIKERSHCVRQYEQSQDDTKHRTGTVWVYANTVLF